MTNAERDMKMHRANVDAEKEAERQAEAIVLREGCNPSRIPPGGTWNAFRLAARGLDRFKNLAEGPFLIVVQADPLNACLPHKGDIVAYSGSEFRFRLTSPVSEKWSIHYGSQVQNGQCWWGEEVDANTPVSEPDYSAPPPTGSEWYEVGYAPAIHAIDYRQLAGLRFYLDVAAAALGAEPDPPPKEWTLVTGNPPWAK